MKKKSSKLFFFVVVLNSLSSAKAMGSECAPLEAFPAEWHGDREASGIKYLSHTPVPLAVEKFHLEPDKKAIYVSMTPSATSDLASLTEKYQEKRLAIVANGRVISSPQIKAPFKSNELKFSFANQADYTQFASALAQTTPCQE